MNRADQSFAEFAEGDWVEPTSNEWELLTGILLDTRTPLERMRKVIVGLKQANMLDYRILREMYRKDGREAVEVELARYSYPWARQKSFYFNQDIEFDLKTATLEQIDGIKGIGPKLAALYMRIVHPDKMNDFVVIDTHVRRWLREELGVDEARLSYDVLSGILREEAEARGITITQLDEAIVENGVNKRRGIEKRVIIPERKTRRDSER